MFRLVMADDERLIIKGLERLLDWESLSIDIVGVYYDGKSALDGIIALRPDIALLDISMPGLSGIDVLRTIRDQGIGTNVIFISGFQDFEYVKAALRYGAKDYILKPIVRTEMLRALEKCLPEKKREDDSGQERNSYSEFLEEPGPYLLSLLLITAGNESPISRLLRFSVKEEVKGILKEKDMLFEEDGSSVFIFFPYGDEEKALKELCSILSEMKEESREYLSFILSRPFYSAAAIKTEKDRTLLYSDFSFFSSGKGEKILSLSALDSDISALSLMQLRDSLFQAAISHNEKEFKSLLSQVSSECPKHSSYKKNEAAFFLSSSCRNLFERLKSAMINLPEIDLRALMDSLMESSSYMEMESVFHKECMELYEEVMIRTGGGSEKEFMVALDYIEKHYMDPIGLKTVSDVVKMNTYYFSSYFKKNTGVNFKDYLRQVRMNHAMELLASSDMSLSQIAKEVGIMDSRTFSDLFYKTFGEKPSVCVRRIRNVGSESYE